MTIHFTGAYYAQHYRPLQRAKYAQAWPHVRPHLPQGPFSMLDLGIGPAWWEEFLAEQGVVPARIVGMDVSEDAVAPRRGGVEYHLTPAFRTDEKFDVVVCLDAWHCFPQLDVTSFLKPNGLLIVSEPRPFVRVLEGRSKGALVDIWAGDTEKSRFICLEKD